MGWGTAPLDVLVLIFKSLSYEDLLNCFHVNCHWKHVVNYVGMHNRIWKEMAQSVMVNRGMGLRTRSLLCWPDLYINYSLWAHMKKANFTLQYELKVAEEIQNMHVYKDVLIVEVGPTLEKLYFNIKEELVDVTDILTSDNSTPTEEASYSFETDSTIKMLVSENPRLRLLVIDEGSFYMMTETNLLLRWSWSAESRQWDWTALGRYYGCAQNITDMNVYKGQIFILVSNGMVFRLEGPGRNFVRESELPYSTRDHYEYIRMLYADIGHQSERVMTLNHKLYFRNINMVVAVPHKHHRFVMNIGSIGNATLEYPGLTCAFQHGELLFLGFDDGRVEIVIPSNLNKNGGVSDIRLNIVQCKCYQGGETSIAAIEVYEAQDCHHVFVATSRNIYRLVVTYPQWILETIGLRESSNASNLQIAAAQDDPDSPQIQVADLSLVDKVEQTGI